MKLLYCTAVLVILCLISLSSCVPFTLTRNPDGSYVIEPPPAIVIPARSAK